MEGGQQLIEHSRIRGSPVSAHLGRARAVLQRADEELASGREIPFLRDEDVDDLAELVDRAVQIDPPPGHFDICLINEPSIPGRVPAGSCCANHQRNEPLHPAIDGHMINADAAFGQ